MEWTDRGFVVARGAFREADIWLRVLFENHGLRTAYAFGGARSRHRFVGCLDALNVLTCHVRVARVGGHLNLVEAELERGAHSLRQAPRALGVMANCLRFTEALGVPESSAPASFRLLTETLEALDAHAGDRGETPRAHSLDAFPSLFQMALASRQGYAPDFERCASCGAPVPRGALFVPDEGCVLCPPCAGASGARGVSLSAAALDALRIVQQKYPLCWEADALAPADRRAIVRVTGAFVQFHLGLSWTRGRYTRV